VVSDEEISLARDVTEQVGNRRLGVITMGEHGARVLYGGEMTDLPGYDVPTVDLTGAGDVFAAAFFIRATDRSASAVTAGKFANAVAALSLRAEGAAGIPSKQEVEQFLKSAEERPIRR
jgi:sugar/nucleoside kinase (ribokinase family)